jgi:hypothetical protein
MVRREQSEEGVKRKLYENGEEGTIGRESVRKETIGA